MNTTTLSMMTTTFGEIELQLFPVSNEIYSLLDKPRVNEIERLKNTDQLGIISECYGCSRHSKWEYTFHQMHLLEFFRRDARAFGLSASVELPDGTKISTLDLCYSWALLLNSGHLEKTFTAERLWFNHIIENPETQDFILDTLPRESFKAYFKGLILNQHFMGFYPIISALFIATQTTKHFSNPQKSRMLDVLELWLSPKGDSLARIKDVYRRIRKISYLLLDCNNTHSFFKIEIGQLLDYIKKNPTKSLYGIRDDLTNNIDALNEHLQAHVYNSIKVSEYSVNYWAIRSENISKTAHRRPSKFEQKAGIGKAEVFVKRLIHAKYDDISASVRSEKWKFFSRINLMPEKPFARTICNYRNEELILNKKFGGEVIVKVEPMVSRGHEASTLDLFHKGSVKNRTRGKIGFSLFKYIQESYRNNKYPWIITNMISQESLHDLLMYCLRQFIREEFEIRLSPQIKNTDTIFLASKPNERKALYRHVPRISGYKNLSTEQKYEISSTIAICKKDPGALLLSVNSVLVYDKDWKTIAEFDGVYTVFRGGKFRCGFVEAKTGPNKSKVALKQLLDSLKNCDALKFRVKNRTRSLKKGRAYSVLELN